MNIRVAVAALATALALAPRPSAASHLAGVSITAIGADALRVDFEASVAVVRPDYYGQYYPFQYNYVFFGDGSYDGGQLPRVTSGPPVIYAGVVTHTYPAPGTFTASVSRCCGNTTIFGGGGGTTSTSGISLTDTTTFTVCDAGDPDADGDGIADGCDDCAATASGAGVDVHGCSCTQKSCDDGVACSVDSCDSATAKCVHAQSDVLCQDSDPCTQDFCNPTTGCVNRATDFDFDTLCFGQDNCPFAYNPEQEDGDGDGDGDICDTCPSVPNPGQEDVDGDGLGDACDPCPEDQSTDDFDNDGRCSEPATCPAGCDNCPFFYNPGQEETDGDGVADACDNCPTMPNADQADGDGDQIGDVCDPCLSDNSRSDFDGDGHCTDPAVCPAGCDICPFRFDPGQEDTDGDGRGDACDNCPTVPNPTQRDRDFDQLGDACDPCPDDRTLTDIDGDAHCSNPSVCPAGCDICPFDPDPGQEETDGDGIGDACDNCPNLSNVDQRDIDFDGLGDACDPCPDDRVPDDRDHDGFCSDPTICPAGCDVCPFVADDQTDSDGDGAGDACDNCPDLSNPSQIDRDQDGIGDDCDDCVAFFCNDGNPCTEDCFNFGTRSCETRQSADGTPCTDANDCTRNDTCTAGTCGGENAPDGLFCSDNNACTQFDRCAGGVCGGIPIVCPAADDCHEGGVCNPATGCSSPPKTNGSPCDDGDACTENDSCTIGVCGGDRTVECSVDHFKCYGADTVGFEPVSATVSDAFRTAEVRLQKPKTVCNPVDKNGEGMRDATAHLACYGTRDAVPTRFTRRELKVTNQFGELTVTAAQPHSLCIPSEKNGVHSALDLDHFACYRLAPRRTERLDVTLADQFESKRTRVLRPYLFCNAVDKNGEGIRNARAHLTCYKIKDAPGEEPFAPRSVNVDNQLGRSSLRVKRARTLCVPSTVEPCAQLVSRSTAGTASCGGPELEPPPLPPFSGALYDDPVAGEKIADLGLGCLHEGGGDSEYYPAPAQTPGSTAYYDVASCSADDLTLVGSAGSSTQDCTLGPSTKRVCANQPGQTCTSDGQCGGAIGTCARLPRCFAGLPLEVTGNIPACILNVTSSDGSGTINKRTGGGSFGTPASNWVYLTFNSASPCPRCLAGTCVGGERHGAACTPGSPTGITHDCPPANSQLFFVLHLAAPPGAGTPVGTGVATLSADDGNFCPGQRNPGAFGEPDARRIVETGVPAGDLTDGAPHAMVAAGVPCIASAGLTEADDLADLPGPNGLSQPGTVQLLQ